MSSGARLVRYPGFERVCSRWRLRDPEDFPLVVNKRGMHWFHAVLPHPKPCPPLSAGCAGGSVLVHLPTAASPKFIARLLFLNLRRRWIRESPIPLTTSTANCERVPIARALGSDGVQERQALHPLPIGDFTFQAAGRSYV